MSRSILHLLVSIVDYFTDQFAINLSIGNRVPQTLANMGVGELKNKYDRKSSMKIVETLPFTVRRVLHCWIPLQTKERLSASLWLPVISKGKSVPAILEYSPYRRRDYSAANDEANHSYLAGHGYACLRVDVRGTGDSDGLHTEQWSEDYDRDAQDVLHWIVNQGWSNGRVGMMGLSWGANTSLRMASRCPPELKAIIPVSAADDRYSNKYLGGCLLMNSIVWGFTMMAQNSRPPSPEAVDDDWRSMWLLRLEGIPCYPANWMRHPNFDDFWASGALDKHLSDFGCPVFIVGGAADPGYAATVPKMLSELKVPVRGLIGPWAHKYPQYAEPGPAIGFLQEALGWFDQWLKDDGSVLKPEPKFRAWMHEFSHPEGVAGTRQGRWIEEPEWPSLNVEEKMLIINAGGRLDTNIEHESAVAICTPQHLGAAAGEWMPWLAFGGEAELPLDQRLDDALSVTFDTPPLSERLEFHGAPAVDLTLSADKPVAMIIARLCDVAPDGTSMRVTYGALDLTHREGSTMPLPLTPGQKIRVQLPLYHNAHSFKPGHSIRLALSTTYWPVLWPTPDVATVTVWTGASKLLLPVRAPQEAEELMRQYGEPETALPLSKKILQEKKLRRHIIRDAATGETVLHHLDDGGCYRLPNGLECTAKTERWLRIHENDPLSARLDIDWSWGFRQKEWQVETRTRGIVTCNSKAFNVISNIQGKENGNEVFQRSWSETIPRISKTS
ncbi:MAG: CocE/NonD family hydrolase [Rhodospirillales bacterium]|nr:CocE/NonD family hydrolase [Rhodospirillales bacterium]